MGTGKMEKVINGQPWEVAFPTSGHDLDGFTQTGNTSTSPPAATTMRLAVCDGGK